MALAAIVIIRLMFFTPFPSSCRQLPLCLSPVFQGASGTACRLLEQMLTPG